MLNLWQFIKCWSFCSSQCTWMTIKNKFLRAEVVFVPRIIFGSSYLLGVICVPFQADTNGNKEFTNVNKNCSGSCTSANGLTKHTFVGESSCMVKGQHKRKGSSAYLPWEAPARWQYHTTSLLTVPWADSFHGQLAFTKHEQTSFLWGDWILADKLDRFPEARVMQLCQSH